VQNAREREKDERTAQVIYKKCYHQFSFQSIVSFLLFFFFLFLFAEYAEEEEEINSEPTKGNPQDAKTKRIAK
jgi:hypothetical protein